MRLSLLSCSLLAATASAKTTLFFPSSDPAASARTVDVSPAEINEVLSHHLDAAYDHVRSARKQIWDHVLAPASALEFDQRASVERLFDGVAAGSKNRLMVLVHGAADANVVPSGFSATHKTSASVSTPSFDALLGSYFGQLQSSLRISDSAFGHLSTGFVDGLGSMAAGVEHALEDAASWLMGSSASASSKTSQWWSDLSELVQQTKSDALETVQTELEAVHSLLDRVRSGDAQADDELAFQPIRIQGLDDVKATYGVDSLEFSQVKKVVRDALKELTEAFATRSKEQGRESTVVFVLNDAEALEEQHRLVKRSSSSSSLLAPFAPRANDALKGDSKKPAKKAPVANLLGTCFTEQKELEKASNKCSGHGVARQTSKGGRKCWRCACQPTKTKGRTTYWAGAACEKKDISTEFVLLGTTGVVLALVSLGSVYFLYAAGQAELPGTLAGVTINLK